MLSKVLSSTRGADGMLHRHGVRFWSAGRVRDSARERVRAAIKNCGFRFPVSRMIANLAPAETKKSGTLYDSCPSSCCYPGYLLPAGKASEETLRVPR